MPLVPLTSLVLPEELLREPLQPLGLDLTSSSLLELEEPHLEVETPLDEEEISSRLLELELLGLPPDEMERTSDEAFL